MKTFEEFLAEAGIDPAETDQADLDVLRKSFDELQGAAAGGDEEATTVLEKAGEVLGALVKSPKMLADLLHHMQQNSNADPANGGGGEGDGAGGEGGEADDGGEDAGDGEGDGEEGEDGGGKVDEEELAATMKDMGLEGDGAGEGEGGKDDEDEDAKEKAGKIRKALMDELEATEILGADEVVGTLLKAFGATLEAQSGAVLEAVDERLKAHEDRLEALLKPLTTEMQKSLDAAGQVPTPRGSLPGARNRQFGNPSLNQPQPDANTGTQRQGVIISAMSKSLLDEATAHAMSSDVLAEDWEEKWGAKYAELEGKLKQ
jgi:hypothetical protein